MSKKNCYAYVSMSIPLGDSRIHGTGMLLGYFEDPGEVPVPIMFCGRGLKCFSPMGGTNSKTTLCLLPYLFFAQYHRLPLWNVLVQNSLGGTKVAYATAASLLSPIFLSGERRL